MIATPDPRWDGHTAPEDVRVWEWRVEDEHGNHVSYPQADPGVHVETRIWYRTRRRDMLVRDPPHALCEAISLMCHRPGERYLVLLADGFPFLRWHAAGKRDCARLDCAIPRVLCGLK